MVESTIKPDTITLDRVIGGKAEILVNWNVTETERTDEMSGKTTTFYVYDQCAFRGNNAWVLPQAYNTISEVEEYLSENETEILDWAKGSKISLKADQ